MAYIGNSPGVASQRIVSKFTATASQTTFTPTSGYTVGYLDVYLNGVKLINGDDYTASNGTTFVLASGAASGDVIEAVAYLPRGLSDGYTKAEADARYMDPAAVSDAANSSTGYFALPAGTTAQRPGSPAAGYTRYNSTTGSLEFYDGSNWIATNLIPSINSITGTIYAGAASTLTLSLTNATDTVDVKYYEGGTLLATDSGVTVTSGSATSTVPSAVYGQTAGDTISISVWNSDGTPSSNSISKTVVGLPTGGTVTTYSTYRVHSFLSSGTFSVPSGFPSTSCSFLVVAGGAGGGGTVYNGSGGGGGAGGMITSTGTFSGGNNYSVTVGAGGAGGVGYTQGSNGQNSSIATISGVNVIGGGGGGRSQDSDTATNGSNGGSGGGGAGDDQGGYTSGGSGTSGQGNAGGGGTGNTAGDYGGGGGGKAASGTQGTDSLGPGAGGNGATNSLRTGSAVYYAGGGGGGGNGSGAYPYDGAGGNGGGGDGSLSGRAAQNGSANTGGGGGGGSQYYEDGANGGSGIVIIRYDLSSL